MIKDILFRLGYNFRIHRLFNPGGSAKTVTVLCLHRISPVNDPLFAPLTPAVFTSLIQWLKKKYEITGFTGIHELRSSSARRKPFLILSFDDGYKDFLEFALPLIRKEKIAVNHNIVVNCAETGQLIWTQRINNILSWLGKTGQSLEITYDEISFHKKVQGSLFAVKKELFSLLFSRKYMFIDRFVTALEEKYSFEQPAGEMMNWDDIITCHKEGVDIGSHTIYHSSLAEYDEEPFFKNEIFGSKKILEEKLQTQINSFAFPNGLAHPQAYQMAINAGYKNLLLVDGVKYNYHLESGPAVHSYKRILIGHHSVYENIFNISGFHRALKGL